MPYVPLVPKTGEIIKTEFPTQFIKDEYVKVLTLGNGGGVWKNQYERNRTSGPYNLTGIFYVGSLETKDIAKLNEKAKNDELKLANDLINEFDTIAGYQVKAPSFADPKDLVDWYRKSILAVVAKLSDDAIKLGQDPNEVGKAVVTAGQTLATISTTIGSLATAGTTLASIASVATPITAGIAVILGALNVLGVFRSDDAENQRISRDYKQLSAVLQFWYEDYARAYAKMNAIDQAEFNKMLTEKYGSGSGSGSGSGGTNVPKVNTQSGLLDIVTEYYQYIILAVILIVLWWYSKRN